MREPGGVSTTLPTSQRAAFHWHRITPSRCEATCNVFAVPHDIDWDLIERHYEDLMRVAVSIKAGMVTPSTLLRRLDSASRKNKLYFAFRELGRVIWVPLARMTSTCAGRQQASRLRLDGHQTATARRHGQSAATPSAMCASPP